MNNDAIDKFTLIIRNQYDEKERKTAIKSIVNAIEKHTVALNDEQLCSAGFIMIDDLYKAANYTVLWDEAISLYLEASAGTFCELLKKRGYLFHYIADNTFPSNWVDFKRPVFIFSKWFNSAGIKYVCPQEAAMFLMKKDKIDEKDYFANLSRYIREAQLVSEEIIKMCHANNDHYVFLNTDDRDSKQVYKCALGYSHSPGVISIIRSDPPVKGSKCSVSFPRDKFRHKAASC